MREKGWWKLRDDVPSIREREPRDRAFFEFICLRLKYNKPFQIGSDVCKVVGLEGGRAEWQEDMNECVSVLYTHDYR